MNYQDLASELTSDPLVRGYAAMTDEQAAVDLNTAYRPAVNVIGEMVNYLLNKKHRTNQGGDDTFSPIIGRLYHVARSNEGDDPLGRAPGGYTGLDIQHVHACQTFVCLFESQHLLSMDFDDADLPYGYVEASGAWSTTHTDDLKSLSLNQITRGTELGLGEVKAADITFARAL